MGRRVFASLTVFALALGVVFPTTVAAASGSGGSAVSFHKVNVTGIDPQVLPYLLDKNRQLDLMVELSDQPVATLVGNATDAGTAVTSTDRATWRSKIKANQTPVVDAIKSHGGRVISQVQDAYNGIHVHLAAGSVAAIAALPNVVAVHLVPTYKPQLTESVPYVGVPQAWSATGQTGAGEKIAVIDTGIDYYHADFGGSGSVADYTYGLAHDTTLPATNADGTTVAFPSAKIPVGYDFVGDAYDAAATAGSPATIPHPDGNPLDCDSHGTHTASTAAGYGELSERIHLPRPVHARPLDGSTDFKIGPGVAPNAHALTSTRSSAAPARPTS
jgi:minor extracellular serine protease Vpr